MPELLHSPAPAPVADLAAQVAARLHALSTACGPRRRWVLGVSGGVDSLLLLELVREYVAGPAGGACPLQVVHVHHGLSPQADAWAARVERHCAAAGIPCSVQRVEVDRSQPSLEAAARQARHAAFVAGLRPGDALLLAHHADDQAETLLLRLLRGSGLGGLGAMREARPVAGVKDAWLWRPLLGVRRAAIVAAATQRGLAWVDDDANADRAHDRNFLRHDVLPLLAARWPALVDTFVRTARRLAAADALLNQYLDADLVPLLRAGDATLGNGGRDTLDAAAVVALPAARRDALLRRWLARIGAPLFAEAWIAELAALAAARADAEGELRVAGWEVHRFRGRLVAFPALPPADGERTLDWGGAHAAAGALVLGPGHGALQAAASGPGLALALPPGLALQVRFRAGGERIAPAGGIGHRPLKKVLQELDVPPWLRARVPLLYAGDRLAAVGDYVVDMAFVPGPGCPATHVLRWQRPG